MKLLLAEDTISSQNSLGVDLRALGYAVDVISDGAEAISQASSNLYDIIILDLVQPKESSLLVLHEIRERNREVEILILSQQDEIHDRVTALIQGADDYLVKPLSADELHLRIQTLIKSRVDQVSRQDSTASKIGESAHLNRLIGNLLNLCQCEHAAIELVISEVRLSDLLDRVQNDLQKEMRPEDMVLRLPAGRTPVLLVDAKWMEHLLAILITNAIIQNPRAAEIEVRFETDAEYCSLEIIHSMQEALSSDELKTMFTDYCAQHPTSMDQPLARQALVKSYADCMNLGLSASITRDDRLCVRLSNIKII